MLYLIVRTAARRAASKTLGLLLSILFLLPRIPPVFAAPKLATKCCSQVKKAQQLQDQEKRRNAERCVAPALLDYTIFGIGEAQFSLEHQTY